MNLYFRAMALTDVGPAALRCGLLSFMMRKVGFYLTYKAISIAGSIIRPGTILCYMRISLCTIYKQYIHIEYGTYK